jgi:hypothetical protein
MENKINAFLDRGEIRDAFDIEFLLRRGVELPALTGRQNKAFRKRLGQFKEMDFKVTLGSILEDDIRNYYVKQRFGYLEEKLVLMQSQP